MSAAISENPRPWTSKNGARCSAVRTPYSFRSRAASATALSTPARSGGVASAVRASRASIAARAATGSMRFAAKPSSALYQSWFPGIA